METVVKVHNIQSLGSSKLVILGNGDEILVPGRLVEKLGITQGVELRAVGDPPNKAYFISDKKVGTYRF